MKKLTVLFVFLVFIITNINANVQLWKILYTNAKTLKDKKNVLIKIHKKADESFKDFILEVIEEQTYHPVSTDPLEKRFFEECVYYTNLTYQKLGMTKGGDFVKALYQMIDNPLYKGELLYTFGQIGGTRYVKWLNTELREFNNQHRVGKTSGLKEPLYGVIKALTKLKHESSFFHLFYAAIPNYSDDIRNLAQIALKEITLDPSELCNNIIIQERDPRIALEALHYVLVSESSVEKKVETCKVALNMSMNKLVEKHEEAIQRQLRNDAVIALGELKPVEDKEVVKIIRLRWDFMQDRDVISKLTNIKALKLINNDESLQALIDFLTEFDELKQKGTKTGFLQEEGDKIIIALIKALGEMKNMKALEVLYSVELNKFYGRTIHEHARRSIDAIEGNVFNNDGGGA